MSGHCLNGLFFKYFISFASLPISPVFCLHTDYFVGDWIGWLSRATGILFCSSARSALPNLKKNKYT